MKSSRAGFTLIELLVVIAIIAVLSVVVVLSLNPAELLRQSRDTNRLSDMDTLNHALSIYAVDQSGMPSFFMGSSSVVYVSLPDSSSTCGNLGLPILPTGYTYNCVSSSSLKNVNGSGWIPIPLSSNSGGSPMGNLPTDPVNQSSSRLYYTYTTNGSQYELTAVLESQKYKLGGISDAIVGDGGTLTTVYEKGSKFGLEPLDYGDPSLVGFWPLTEGSGTVAYDESGNRNNGTWQGGSSAFITGKIGPYAASFNGSTYISMSGTSSAYTGLANISVSAWYAAATSTANLAIVSKHSGGTGGEFSLGVNPYNNNKSMRGFTINTALSRVNCDSNTSFNNNDGNWHLFTMTYDGANIRNYVDGVLAGSPCPQTGVDQSTAIALDINAYSTFASVAATMNDVRIYSRALSAAEITALYNGGK